MISVSEKCSKEKSLNWNKKKMNDQVCFIPLKLFNHAEISQLSRFLLDSKILILHFQTPL